MNADKVHGYREAWRHLQTRQRNLDFARSQWAAQLRAEFPANSDGEGQFVRWCGAHIALSAVAARELLARAAAVAVVPDEQQWGSLGGFDQIRSVLSLPKSKQVRAIESARTAGKTVRAAARALSPQRPSEPTVADDARKMAEYLLKLSGVPAEVRRAAERRAGRSAVVIRKAA